MLQKCGHAITVSSQIKENRTQVIQQLVSQMKGNFRKQINPAPSPVNTSLVSNPDINLLSNPDTSLLSIPRPNETIDNDFGSNSGGMDFSQWEPVSPISSDIDPDGSIFKARTAARDHFNPIQQRKKQCLIEIQAKNKGI